MKMFRFLPTHRYRNRYRHRNRLWLTSKTDCDCDSDTDSLEFIVLFSKQLRGEFLSIRVSLCYKKHGANPIAEFSMK